MSTYDFTPEEIADILQGLNASIHRLRGKVINDTRKGLEQLNQVIIRQEKIKRCEQLIEKMKVYELEIF